MEGLFFILVAVTAAAPAAARLIRGPKKTEEQGTDIPVKVTIIDDVTDWVRDRVGLDVGGQMAGSKAPTKTSSKGLSAIKKHEGLHLEAYQDIAGIWTIGYGHTGSDVVKGRKITQAEADSLLESDVQWAENAVTGAVSVPITQEMFDALVSFTFNVGSGALRSSTALERLNSGNYTGAADALTWWNKARVAGVLRPVDGLTNRRNDERDLFLSTIGDLGGVA